MTTQEERIWFDELLDLQDELQYNSKNKKISYYLDQNNEQLSQIKKDAIAGIINSDPTIKSKSKLADAVYMMLETYSNSKDNEKYAEILQKVYRFTIQFPIARNVSGSEYRKTPKDRRLKERNFDRATIFDSTRKNLVLLDQVEDNGYTFPLQGIILAKDDTEAVFKVATLRSRIRAIFYHSELGRYIRSSKLVKVTFSKLDSYNDLAEWEKGIVEHYQYYSLMVLRVFRDASNQIIENQDNWIRKYTNEKNSDNLFWVGGSELRLPEWRTLINEDGSLFGNDFSEELESMINSGYLKKKLDVQLKIAQEFDLENFVSFE